VPVTLKVAVNSDSIATWFPEAAARFAKSTRFPLDFIIEDEGLSADRLRSDEVLAAVSGDPEAVQGCRTIELGSLEYLACCSPDSAARHFVEGITEQAHNRALCLRFERRDGLQARRARETHGVELNAPMHWVHSSFGFLNSTPARRAWGMQPAMLVRPWIAEGLLVELSVNTPIAVKLYWTISQRHAKPLKALSDHVRQAARRSLCEG